MTNNYKQGVTHDIYLWNQSKIQNCLMAIKINNSIN